MDNSRGHESTSSLLGSFRKDREIRVWGRLIFPNGAFLMYASYVIVNSNRREKLCAEKKEKRRARRPVSPTSNSCFSHSSTRQFVKEAEWCEYGMYYAVILTYYRDIPSLSD